MGHGASWCIMVDDAWCIVHGASWCIVHDAGCMMHDGAWCMMYGKDPLLGKGARWRGKIRVLQYWMATGMQHHQLDIGHGVRHHYVACRNACVCGIACRHGKRASASGSREAWHKTN